MMLSVETWPLTLEMQRHASFLDTYQEEEILLIFYRISELPRKNTCGRYDY